MSDQYKLPRIPRDHISYILREAASKVERGEALQTGKSESGSRLIEGDMIAAVLRAVADGKSPIKALVGNGPAPKSTHSILERFRNEFSKHGGNKAKAFAALARKERRKPSAVKQEYTRTIRKEQEYWRRKYLSGEWPKFEHWRMTDSEIEIEANRDLTGCDAEGNVVDFPIRYVDEVGNEVDPRDIYRRRRTCELEIVHEATGWKILPPWEGDKSPP